MEKPATSLIARSNLIAASLGLLIMAAPVARAQFNYATNADGVSIAITGYTGHGGSVIIPAATNGLPVTLIHDQAFEFSSNVTSITIPDSVTDIGSNAFLECTKLAGVSMGDSVTNLEAGAFWGCTGLSNITLPESTLLIGKFAFNDCTRLTNVTFSNGIVSLGEGAFAGAGLSRVTIPGSVTNIGPSAFAYSSLASVTMGDGVVSIGSYAFNNCSRLTSVAIPASVTSIGDSAFAYCGLTNVAIPGGLTNLANAVFSHCSSLAHVTVPTGVTIIGDFAFADCYALADFPIPSGLTSIGDSAFAGCYLPTSLTIPGSVTRLGEAAFSICLSLTNVTLPGSVTNLGAYVFSACLSLTDVTIPGSVLSLGDYAFQDCTALKNANLNNGITNIGNYDFSDCYSLTTVAIPASVLSIGSNAFPGCSNLIGITIPNGVATIGASAFADTGLASVMIPNGVTSLGSFAFGACSNLASVSIPASITHFGPDAFQDCPRLTTVNLADGTASIGDFEFSGCSSLTDIAIPGGVTSIGDSAFQDCGRLTEVTIEDGVAKIGNYAFSGCSNLASVTLPDSLAVIGTNAFSESGLTSIEIPGGVASIGEGAFSGCSSLTAITVDATNAVYSSVNGILFDKDQTALLEYPGGQGKSYAVPNGVTFIGAEAFAGASLTNLTISDSVTNIGDSAFSDCVNLISIYFNGDAPAADSTVFDSDKNATVYYLLGTTGWNSVFAGVPAVLLNPEFGSLKVTLSPAPAITAGAEWQVGGGKLQKSGATVSLLLVGGHTVSFKTVNGWFTPSNQIVFITSNSTSTATGTYAAVPPNGSVQVTLFPAAAVTDGAQWRVDGGAWRNSGATVTNLSITNHIFSFNPVSGWTTPSNQSVKIKAKSVASLRATYSFTAQGIYNGLFLQAQAAEATAGMLSGLDVTSSASYSATLLIGGNSYPVSGGFNSSGQGSNYVQRAAVQGGSLILEMGLNWTNSPPNITGTVSGTNGSPWVASLTNELAVAGSKSAAYTALISPSGVPPGYGYLLITNHAGAITLSGALADGTPFSQHVPLSGQGALPVYANLYKSAGLLLGWISLEGGSPTGNLTWIKPSSRSTTLYTNGFTNLAIVQGSIWTNPLPHTASIDLPSGQLDISGGSLLSNLSFSVSVNNNNTLVKLPDSPTNSLSGSIASKTGLLTITFGNGVGKAAITGLGAVIQNATNASGFFLGKTNAGSILLKP